MIGDFMNTSIFVIVTCFILLFLMGISVLPDQNKIRSIRFKTDVTKTFIKKISTL